ncbi:hypothetical protein Y032_0014g2201 [Ancylostoma ceylanicum]|uniref:Uncharacterized protein n=1 Tax=Ancylostoma ceylanicum TaxID=53326 RepID=A0A016V8A1_9BILA|nr:hypothetical protein Y032_0014g2201 [Ancylostoma ceylanicum]
MHLIALLFGTDFTPYLNVFYFSKSEQQRLLGLQREACATALLSYHTEKERTESDDGYFSVSSAATGQDDRPTQVN